MRAITVIVFIVILMIACSQPKVMQAPEDETTPVQQADISIDDFNDIDNLEIELDIGLDDVDI